jgi:hypothetical protein
MVNHPNRALDSKVRRVAKAAGLSVCKARGHEHGNNKGGYQLINDRGNIVEGPDFGLSADDVLYWCRPENRKRNLVCR